MSDWEDVAFGPAATVTASADDGWEDVAAAPAAVAHRGGMSALGEIGQGLTFGFLPEIEGATSAVGNLLKNVVGYGNDRSFAQNYAATRDASEAELKAYEKENPWTSTGLQVGGALIPSIAGGVARVGLGAAEAGTGLLSSLARNVFGVGIKEAPTVGQLARMGATQGALFGAGNANEGERLKGAATGGAIGAVAAPVVGKTIEAGGRFIADKLTDWGLLRPGMLASERGALGDTPNDIARSLTPEEMILAKQLKNTPLDKITAGAKELTEAAETNVPLFLPEAVNSPKVTRNAKFIANYEPSVEFSQTAIQNRTAGAETRASELFDIITPNRDTYLGARNISKGAKEIIEAAEKAREEAAAPWYMRAYSETPTIDAPELQTLLKKDKTLASAIKEIKKTANNADLPDNSTELLVKARKRLWETRENLLEKYPSEAMDVKETYDALNAIMKKESSALAVADEAFAAGSRELDALGETLIPSLANVAEDKAQNIGRLMNLPASRISDLRNVFKEAGKLKEWEDGVRSYLQSTAEAAREGQNFTLKLASTTEQTNKLKAALGDKADEILEGLDLEKRFFEGKNKYFAGSPTQPLAQEQKEFTKGVGILSKIANSDFVGAIQSLFDGGMPDEVARNLAKIYFDPKAGAASLQKVIPILEQYATNSALASGAGQAAGTAATLTSAKKLASIPMGAGALAQTTAPPAQQSAAPLTSQQPQSAPSSSLGQTSTTGNAKGSDSLLQPTSTGSGNQDFKFMNTLFKGDKMDKLPAAQVIEEIKKNPVDHAIMLMESNGNPKAKNPESSASGLFQLIKKTAGNLGVKDVFDPAENYAGYLKLKEETIRRFGKDDVETIYAAHYLGAPTLAKWMNGEELSYNQAEQVQYFKNTLLPKLRRIYSEITSNDVVKV